MTDKAKAYCETLSHIPFNVVFVPQSMSRNAGKEPSLNWLVTFGSIQTDYFQGIGHLPGFDHSNRSVAYHDRIAIACEKGVRIGKDWPHRLGRRLDAPELHEILYCLVSDSDVIDYACFEDWADCMGYDTDSRKAEETYDACMAIALKLRNLVDLDKAREAFEDY